MDQELPRIAWHPAFLEAIQLELGDYRDSLEFIPELQLTSEPLKIDCVIIKKPKDLVINKNIAAIFKEINLIEYKSPMDHISIHGFYKVYAYACLYASFYKVPISDLTLTFIVSRHPRKLISYLKKTCAYTLEESSRGIYIVKGDILQIQIIHSGKLSTEENLWLRDLRMGLGAQELVRVFNEIQRQGEAARIGAYLNVIARANKSSLKELIKMSNDTLTLEEIFEEAGFIKKWEERGIEKGIALGQERFEEVSRDAQNAKERLEAIVRNALAKGYPLETICDITGLDVESIEEIRGKR